MLFGVAGLPVLAGRAGGGVSPVTVVLLLAGALGAAAMCTSGARRDAENPALARLLAVDTRAATGARALLPAALAALWLAVALAALSLAGALTGGAWWLFGPAAAPALAAGALRMARRRPVDHSMPVIDTPGGAIPTGPLFWAMTGVDLALLGCIPLLTALVAHPAAIASYLLFQACTASLVLIAYVRGFSARTSRRAGRVPSLSPRGR